MRTDFRLALRALTRSPAYALAVITTLALAIGATTTLYSVMHAVVFNRLPFPDDHNIVSLSYSDRESGDHEVGIAPWIQEWQRSARTTEAIAAYTTTSGVLTGAGESSVISGASVTPEYFRVMGVNPAFGRGFNANDVETAEEVMPVVLSDALWKTRFGGDSSVINRTITVDGHARMVVGVMPPAFVAPAASTFWEPLKMRISPRATPANPTYFVRYYWAAARIRPGTSLDDVSAELTRLGHENDNAIFGKVQDSTTRAVAISMHERLYGATRRPVFLLTCAVGFLFLIACANVANLSLARAAARQRDFAVRRALGASPWRLARATLTESVLLALIGGAAGLLIPFWAIPLALRYRPPSFSLVSEIPVSGSVLAFTAMAAIATGLLFGLLPAITSASARAMSAFRPQGSRVSGGTAQRRLRHAMVVGELAVALALVTGAGLLTRSLANVMRVDTEFRGLNVTAANIYLPDARYQTDVAQRAFFETLAERISSSPNAEVVAYSQYTAPLRLVRPSITQTVTNSAGTRKLQYAFATVSREYPRAAGLIPVSGRMFARGDGGSGTNVVMLSESAAKMLFPDRDAVGQQYDAGLPNKQPATIIGVVRDVAQPSVEAAKVPVIYRLIDQAGEGPSTLVVRTRGDERAIHAIIRAAVAQIDPLQAVSSIASVDDVLNKSTSPRRLSVGLIVVFATLAIILSAVGLYGVLAYQLAQRRKEFGVRLALGASNKGILGLVFGEGMLLVAAGTILGSLLAYAMSRILESMLYGVTIHDPLSFVVAPAVLAVVAAVTCYVPARRAARIEPMEALRDE